MKLSKIKKGYTIPPVDTFRRWLGGDKRGLANTIGSNKTSKNKKGKHEKFPELDYLVCDFINRSESLIYDHGFGLCWSVIQVQAL